MKSGFVFLVIVITGLSAVAGAQPLDLTGSWKEVRRMPRGSGLQEYTDTTFYDFLIGNEYTTQRKGSFMYRGTYKATPGILDLGMRMYNILERTPGRLLLKDDGGSYEFVRYEKAVAVAANTGAASGRHGAYKEGELDGVPVAAVQLAGKWEVYKRTSSTTISKLDHTRIIRRIEIKFEGGGVAGSVYATKDLLGAPSWKVTRYENNIIFCSGKDERRLKVLRYSKGELILQEDNITYFFRSS